MITPSFGITATERVLPRMALDFTTATLDPRVTFTRSGNTATVTNSSGLIAPINANLPRFDYNPITLACKGLLIEEARTNFLLYSEQFNVTWVKTDTTVTQDSIVSPDGTLNADLITEGTVGSSNTSQVVTIVANSTNTFSVFLKRGNTDWIRFVIWDAGANSNRITAWVNLATGALGANVVNGGVATGGVATITNAGNGWYRVTLSGAVNNSSLFLNCLFSSAAGDGVVTRVNNSTYYAWGAQLEAGAFPTSYIPTVASTVTRNADVATMTGTNFSSWFNASEGAFYSEAVVSRQVSAAGTGVYVASNAVTNSMAMFYRGSGATGAQVVDGGATQADLSPTGVLTANQVFKSVLAYKANDFAASGNAGTVVTDATGTVPTLDRLFIGTNVNYLNGHVRKISYYPQRLINAEVQAFSK